MTTGPPDSRNVRQRIGQVIVGSTDEEKRAVMQEIKRQKPFLLDYDIDSSIVLHLCRSFTDFVQQPDPPLTLDPVPVLNMIRTAIKTIPTCGMVNEPLREGSGVSLHDHVVPLVAAVLLRLPAPHFSHTERLLVQFLMDPGNGLRAGSDGRLVHSCSERQSKIRIPQTEFLCQLALQFPANDFRRNNITSLISRFMRFMDSDSQQFLIRKYDPCTNAFHFALTYLSNEQKEADLKRLVDQIFDSDSCSLTHVQSACHLLTLVSQPDETTVRKMKELVVNFSDKTSDPAVSQVISQCERLLSGI